VRGWGFIRERNIELVISLPSLTSVSLFSERWCTGSERAFCDLMRTVGGGKGGVHGKGWLGILKATNVRCSNTDNVS